MTIGVGGSSAEVELAKLSDMTTDVQGISVAEIQQRQQQACKLMQAQQIDALYLNAGSNLLYFTGLKWYASERMVGALLTAKGELHYIAPAFEQSSLTDFMQIEAPFHGWHEHESPYELLATLLHEQGLTQGRLAVDEASPFFLVDGIARVLTNFKVLNGSTITSVCRQQKSSAEIALMQRAKDMTMAVHKATAAILHEGISTIEVTQFIHQAHKKVGASGNASQLS